MFQVNTEQTSKNSFTYIGYYMEFVASNDSSDFSGMRWIDLSTVPKSVYVIGLPKGDFSFILFTKVVHVLSKPFFPAYCHTGSTV